MGGGGEQMEKRFSWVLKKFSSLQEERCYSRPFAVAGVNWRIAADCKGDKNDGHLSLFLEFADSESLPPGWTRDVKFSLTLVTKAFTKSNLVVRAQQCFSDEIEGWGCDKFVSLSKLHEKGEGFLVNNKIIILAELHVLPAEVESVGKSQRDSSCEAAQETEVTNLDDDDDDDDGPFDEGTGGGVSSKEDVDNDDVSSPCLDDGGEDISLLNHFSALEETVGNDGLKSNSVAAETEVSNDDAPKEDIGDESSSLVSNDNASNGTSLDKVKSLLDVENGGKEFNNVASVPETANNLLTEIQPANVNGFDVYSSQVESVSLIFRRHPDLASGFRPKNRQIRRAYMNELLSLIEMMCQSPEKLSEDDLSNAVDTLSDLIDVGFKLDWLKVKLDEVSEKKKKEKGSEARLRTMEEQLKKLKLMFLDLQTQLQKEKAEALAARTSLSFSDVVC
ncbi:MATH domain and coiled-coil domain-containing protein At3g58410 isoform X2 [Brassica rapa]|nr:MATH domain and coiled-coil domain-containing protein At3g58410 isoform X2 [Brassica rapa]